MAGSLRDEFRLRNIGFDYDKPYHFTVSQWPRMPDGVFIAWRVFWAVWHLGWLARSVHSQIVENEYGEKWLIYLTNWSFLALVIQSVLHLGVVIAARRARNGKVTTDQAGAPNPVIYKILWLFTDVSFAGAIVVTFSYWLLVFEELTKALTVVTHAVVAVYAISDTFISASPVHLLHCVYPLAYGLLYNVFSVIYYLADGTNNDGEPYIYSAQDWSKPLVTFALTVVGLGFVACPLAHVAMFCLYTLRLYIRHNCCADVAPEEEESNSAKP